MPVTPDLLIAAVGCTPERAALFAPWLAQACDHYRINTAQRLAAFLAQVGHESGSFQWVREIATGQAYEGRRDLGNTQTGDGPRYRGRGLIQITGRDNYRATADRLQTVGAPDFEHFPEALEEPEWAAWSAADWWAAHGCNELADADQVDRISKTINRGNPDAKLPANGAEDRRRRWERAKSALATYATATPANTPSGPPVAAAEPNAPMPEPMSEPKAPSEDDLQAGRVFQQPESTPMPIPLVAFGAKALLSSLAGTLIETFTPLAKEKLQAEIARHTDRPEVIEQLTDGIITAAKAATGMADPVQAVAAAAKSPVALQQVERSALDTLAQLAPVLEQLTKLDQAQWQRDEDSRAAADARARASPATDQDEYLTRSIVRLMVGVLLGGALLTGGLAYLKVDVQVLLGALLALVGAIGGKFSTRYDHRYGSSSGSAAKDTVNLALIQQQRK